jgi:hypothetical protein
MTIQNALNFIRQGQQENDLRIKLVKDRHQSYTAKNYWIKRI